MSPTYQTAGQTAITTLLRLSSETFVHSDPDARAPPSNIRPAERYLLPSCGRAPQGEVGTWENRGLQASSLGLVANFSSTNFFSSFFSFWSFSGVRTLSPIEFLVNTMPRPIHPHPSPVQMRSAQTEIIDGDHRRRRGLERRQSWRLIGSRICTDDRFCTTRGSCLGDNPQLPVHSRRTHSSNLGVR